MKHQTKNRILSFFLALVMLCTSAPFPAISVEPEEQESVTAPEGKNFSADIGKLAVFSTYFPVPISDKPANVNNPFGTDAQQLTQEEVPAELVLTIVDWYYNEAADSLWYKVQAAPGFVLPEKLKQYPWVFHDYVEDSWGASLVIREDLQMPSLPGDHGVTVSAFNLPEGATVDVKLPEINGETIPGLYDIKIIVDGEEWQPIDHNTTVQISIPVEGDIATVTHFIDYAPAIHDGLVFESVADADEEALALFQPAIDAYEEKYGNRDYVAMEIVDNVPITNGFATVTTNSFSIYKADGADTEHKGFWMKAPTAYTKDVTYKNGTTETTYTCYDNGVFYVDRIASNINGGGFVRVQMDRADSAKREWYFNSILDFGYKYTYYVSMYYSTDQGKTWIDLEEQYGATGKPEDDRQINNMAFGDIYVNDQEEVPTNTEFWVLVVDTRSEETEHTFARFIVVDNVPTTGTIYFKENSEDTELDSATYTKNDTSEKGDYLETYYPDGGYTKLGYQLDGWKAITVTNTIPGRGWIPGNIYTRIPEYAHGNVVLEAVWTPERYSITYDLKGGTMPGSYPTAYTIEDTVVLPIPTLEGHTFSGWEPNDAGNWGTDEISRGSSVQGKYGHVELTAKWSVNSGIAYTVKHIYKGLPGQEDEVVEETLYDGTYGQNTNAVVRQVVGFTGPNQEDVEQKLVDNEPVVVEIIYTRNVNTITWNPNNGQEAWHVSCVYGMVISSQTAPGNTGYQFVGWNGYTEGMTMPDEDVTFTAMWAVDAYTITFNSNGGSDLAPVNFAYNATVDLNSLPIPTREGHIFKGWSAPDGVTVTNNQFNMPARDITVTAEWIEATCTVTWVNYDGTVLEIDENVRYGTTPTYDGSTPTKAATEQYIYTFSGWKDSNGMIYGKDDELPAITGDVIYTAVFTESTRTYTVTWIIDADQTIEQNYEYGATIVVPEVSPKTGYNFKGWTPDVPATMPAENLVFTAQWELKTYTVTYDLGFEGNASVITNADKFTPQTKTHGVGLVLHNIQPTATGATFLGWDADNDGDVDYAIGATYALDQNVTLKAIWDPTPHKIRYNVVGLPDELAKQYAEHLAYYDDVVTLCQFVFEGYTLESIVADGGLVIDADNKIVMPDRDVLITITYSVNQYTIQFESNGGTQIDPIMQNYGTELTAPKDPTKTGHTFKGWYRDEQLTVRYEFPTTMPAEDITLYAKWEVNRYTITFDTDGGNTIASITLDYGEAVTAPENPTKVGHTFAGWDPEIPSTMPAENITIKAKWTVNTYTITWVNHDGTVLETDENVPYGTEPEFNGETPTMVGDAQYSYTFKGWTPTVSSVTGDVTYKAEFTQTVNKYTITWVDGDGNTLKTEQVAYGATPVYTGVTPTKTPGTTISYTFSGWTPAIVAVTGDATYTATFTETVRVYTVTWIVDGTRTDRSYTYNQKPSYGEDPKKNMDLWYTYTFSGWTSSLDGNVYRSEDLAAVTSDVTYTATYTQTECVVYIGMNLSYHLPGGTYKYTDNAGVEHENKAYHVLPSEPYELSFFEGRRVYQNDNGEWVVSGSWNRDSANYGNYFGLAKDYISADILNKLVTNNSTRGIFDENGIQEYFQFVKDDPEADQAVYQEILKAWLKLPDLGATDIFWEKVPLDACKIVPYVIKQQSNGHWYIDMVIIVEETSLTIEVPEIKDSDGQMFLFEITAVNHPNFGFVVAVPEGSSVTINGLFVGKQYIIKELTGWSWRCSDLPGWKYTTDVKQNVSSESIDLSATGTGDEATIILGTTGNKLVFTNTLSDPGWLGDETSKDNNFGEYTP